MVSISQVYRVDGVPRGCAFHRARRVTSARWAALGRPLEGSLRGSGTMIRVRVRQLETSARPLGRSVAAARAGAPPASRRALDHASTRAGAAFPGPTTHNREP